MSKLIKSGNWFILPPSSVAAATTGVTVYTNQSTPEQLRKGSVMANLFQVGVIFQHKGSKILWEVVEVIKSPSGEIRWATCKSQKSGYKKTFYADEYSYDSLSLHDAPPALRILFGDEKHVKSGISSALETPQEAEQAFDIELEEDEIL